MKILFLFIDGVGLREPAADNPVNPEVCPALCRLIERHSVPIDACLSVEGLPQSATGQATMFTGVNAPLFMGRHCEGFPGPGLRRKIEEDNLFLQLRARGKRVKFADAYLVESAAELVPRRFKSVTTVMALTTPEDAADHLFNLARAHDFTLYAFFQTDVSGHSMDYDRACSVLRTYDRFLSTLVRFTEAAGITLLMTADHGNIEAMNERGHTRNPVPFIAFGPREAEIRAQVKSLVDVTPTVLKYI